MADTFLVIGTGPTVNLVLGTAQTTNIVLSGAGPVYTAGTGIAISGANVISNTAPDQTVTMTDGTGIDVTGAYPNFTVTNTSPNVVQTLSIAGQDLTLSAGGGTVEIPGVSWPLLAPDGSDVAPSYSFVDAPLSGMYSGSKGIVIWGGGGRDVSIKTQNETIDDSQGITISTGSSEDGGTGTININAGESTNGTGGGFSFQAGAGGAQGGSFTLNAGNSSAGAGGAFDMLAGSSAVGAGGNLNIQAGGSDNDLGGNVVITPGSGLSGNGKVVINGGSGFVLPSLTTAQRNSLSGVSTGTTIYNTDATANDGSTGVMQVYNGSTWKNCW